MEIFMSGEIEGEVYDSFSEIQKEIAEKIKILESNDYGSEVVSIGIMPTLVSSDLLEAGFFKKGSCLNERRKMLFD
jgi:hypothetical protein